MRYLVIIFLLTLNGLVWLWGHDNLRSVGLPAPSLSTDASSERPNDAKAAKAAAEAAAETDGALAPDAARDVAPVALVAPVKPSAPASPSTPTAETPTSAVPPPFTNATSQSVMPASCWQARFWPAEAKSALLAALTRQVDDVLWRLLPSQLDQGWVVINDGSGQALAQLKTRLRRAGLDYRDSKPPFPPGVIVGTFSTEGAANALLAELNARREQGFEVKQSRPDSLVWEVAIYAHTALDRDRLLEALDAIPRYDNGELRISD
ncbi:MAG: hypothetical protein QNK94_05320, partial [Comamonadaceae bacterium]